MEPWKRNLIVMWFAQWSGMVTITFIMSFIPLYVGVLGVHNVRLAGIWAGILMGASALFASIFSPIWGNLADRYGRKIMVQRVLFSNTIVTLLMALTTNVWQFLGLRVIQGVLGGFSAAAVALVASLTPREKTGFALGIFQSAMVAGAASGPLLGGFLVDTAGPKPTFVFMGLASLLPALAVRFLVREDFTPAPAAAGMRLLSSARQLLAIPGLLPIVVINFLIQFSLMIIGPVIPLFIKSLVRAPEHIAFTSGLVIAVGGIFSALSAIGTGRFGDRFGQRKLLVFMITGAGLTFAAQALVRSTPQFLALRAVNGVFTGGMLPTTLSLINSLVPPERRATAFGLTTSFSLLGNVFGPISGGVLAAAVGLRGVFPITAILLLLAAVWVSWKVAERPAPDLQTK